MKASKSIAFLTVSLLFVVIAVAIYQFVILPSSQVKDISGCVPMKFKKEERDSNFYLLWTTKDECTGYVRYGSSQNSYPYLALDEQGVVKMKNHSVKLNGIVKGR
jgi:hypothetical protein